MKYYTKKEHVEYLTDIGAPQDDLKSNGGRIPDYCKYGDWMRKNDPIAFHVGYNEEKKRREDEEG